MSKWCYVINYLNQIESVLAFQDRKSMAAEDEEIWKQPLLLGLGIELIPISLIWNWESEIVEIGKMKDRIKRLRQDRHPSRLFGLKIRGGEKNDGLAQRFAEATMATIVLVTPLPMTKHHPMAFGIPYDMLGENGEIEFTQMVEIDSKRKYKERYSEYGLLHLYETDIHLGRERLVQIWKAVPALLTDTQIFEAAHYYWGSIHEFDVAGDSMQEVIEDINSTPVTRIGLMKAENAIQNAFKALEALIGDPPKDERRLRGKIKAAGLDPDEKIGWDFPDLPSQPILAQVKRLSHIRDKRAAHGRTGAHRRITYFEMMDAQMLALTFIDACSHKRLQEMHRELKETGLITL